MANTILNFHFDYRHPSLYLNSQKEKRNKKRSKPVGTGLSSEKAGGHLDKVVYYPRPRPRRTTGVLGLLDLVKFGVIRVELRRVE